MLAQTVVLFFSCIFLILYFCSCFFPLCSSFLFFVLLLFLFYLSTMFNPLCSGSVAVLLFSVVHSGGFAVANDSSRWLFPCSLLPLLLLPRFSFSLFFLFLCSLSGLKNNLSLSVFLFFPLSSLVLFFSPLPLFVSASFTQNFSTSPSFPPLFFNSGFSSPKSRLFSLCFVFFLRFSPLFFLSISPFVSSFNLSRSS